MPAKKKSYAAKNNGQAPGFNVGKNATIRKILAEARTFMTPEEYRDFSRKPKDKGIRTLNVRKGATISEIYAAARKNFTAWDLQRYTIDEPMVPSEQVLAEMEEIYRRESAKLKPRAKRNRKKG